MTDTTRRRLLKNGAALAALSPLAACLPTPSEPGNGSAATTPIKDALMTPEPSGTLMPASIPDGVEQLRMLASGETTSLDLTQAAIGRARALNPEINAIVNDTFDEALEQAINPPEGAFGGVPTFIKDLLNWKDVPAEFGSRAFKGNVPDFDAPFAESWRGLGVISLGKSTTPEEGLISSTEPLSSGATRNPHDLSRIPGGSSGGAAALVAARIVPFAHASDGGGSIRIPAACCGLFGLKPSRGAMPASRTAPAPISISVNHAVTLTVRDSAALYAATTIGPDAGAARIVEPSTQRLKIAYAPDPINGASLDSETRAGIDRTAQLCRDLGHEVIDWTMPVDGVEFGDKFLMYWAAGAAAFAQQASQFSGNPPSPEILEPWTLGLAMQFMRRAGEIEDVIAYLKAFEGVYHSWFSDFDLILTPTVATVAPKIGEQAPDGDFDTVMENVLNFAAFTSPMNVSGAASMSVPIQWSSDGLPIGSMFSGKIGDDQKLLELAYELEQAQPWIDRMPTFKSS
jgi:amidase